MNRSGKKVRPLTPIRLERYAIWYLERWPAPSPHLRKILIKRMKKAEECEVDIGHVDALIARFQQAGVVNDELYATDRARSLHRRGNAPQAIRSKLSSKGLYGRVVDDAIAALGEGAALEAARGYARKRRLGHWGEDGDDREQYQKDLAKLARRGFSYDIARTAMQGDPEDG